MALPLAQEQEVELSPPDKRSARPPLYPPEDGAQEPTQLVELLTRASDVIREERAKVAALRECLRGVLDAYAADPAALPQYLARELLTMQNLMGSGASSSPPPHPPPAPVSPRHSSATPTLRRQASCASYAEQQQRRRGLSPVNPHAMSSADAAHTHRKGGDGDGAPAAAAVVLTGAPEDRLGRRGPAFEEQTQAMAYRLRRALAPAPSREQLAEVVDAMVRALESDVRSRRRQQPTAHGEGERTIALERVGPCAYRVFWGTPEAVATARAANTSHKASNAAAASSPRGAPRCRHKLVHLSIDSGKLTVLAGGGHVNFLEYLEKNLHVKL